MSQQLQVFTVTAPGFLGLNSQASPLDLEAGFALTATNCVIDQYGRIASRKGWSAVHSTNAALGTADVKAIGEVITASGVSYKVACGNNKLFLLDTGAQTLTELTYGGGGVAPTITDSHWSIAALNGSLWFFQGSHDPLVFDPATSTTTYRRVSEMTGYTGSVPLGNVVISAYGRLWVADTSTDKTTLYFSDQLAGQKWTAGTSGTLDISTVWPRGGDAIVTLGAHNGFLFIFGKRNTIIYTGAATPATMTLQDVVAGIGCVARDSVQTTGTDLIFLSDTGLRSISRLVQEKSAPNTDLSKNVRTDLLTALSGETVKNIKSGYNPFDGFYVISFPTLQMCYCFDMKQMLQDGSARVTTWDSMLPTSFFFLHSELTMLIGRAGFVGSYSGYLDGTSTYRFQYFTNHADLGDASVTSILKKISVVVFGGSGQIVTIKWGYDFTGAYQAQNVALAAGTTSYFGTSEYNVGEYASGVRLQTLVAYPTGSGKIVQTGYEVDVNGSPVSVQKLELQAKSGKIV